MIKKQYGSCFLIFSMGMSVVLGGACLGAPSELSLLSEQIDVLQARLAADKTQQKALMVSLRSVEMALGKTADSLRQTEQQVQRQELIFSRLHDQKRQLVDQVATDRALLARYVREMYLLEKGRSTVWFLAQGEQAMGDRAWIYFNALQSQRQRALQDLEKTLEALALTENRMQVQGQILEKTRVRLSIERQQLLLVREKRNKLLAVLSAEIKEKMAQLGQLEENKRALQRLVDGLTRQQGGGGGAVFKPHRLPWPVRGEMMHRFGTPIEQSDLTWNGLLIKAEEGVPVYAVASGEVVFANWLKGFGLLVILDHGGGYMTLYGRNRSLYRQVGDRVLQGDQIAAVGESGGYAGSGLYFELRHEGRPQDPARFLMEDAR